MFRSIFRKLIIIFLAILLFSLAVTGTILYIFLGNSVTREKVDMLKTSADEIHSGFIDNLQYINDTDFNRWFASFLKLNSKLTNSSIWIVDTKGDLAYYSPDISAGLAAKMKSNSYILHLPDTRQYKDVMTGKSKYIEVQGDFYGLFKDTGSPWLTVEKPIKGIDKKGKEVVIGAIYLHTKVPEINKARLSIFRLFIFSVFVSVLLSIVLVYIFSLRISKPLKEIKNASKVIANGEFQKRLDIKSKDEIGELANSFNQMAHALENLEEMRRGFIANISHELRTPMTSIRGFIEGILDGTIPPENQSTYLVIVRDEINRLNRLANDLLTLAKLEAGELKLNLRNFDINELLRRSVIKMESLLIEKDLHVQADFEEEEMQVNADPDEIERVVINLIHNAIKFTGEKGQINISTLRKKDKVFVSIQDSGAGIDENEIDLIWERFYKSDKSRSMDKSGTGLGLAIVKNIILEHDQEIFVESEPGKGAKFIFTLKSTKDSEI